MTERDYHIEGRMVRQFCINYLRGTRRDAALHGEWIQGRRAMLKNVLMLMRSTRRVFNAERRKP